MINLDKIIEKAFEEQSLNQAEIKYLLSLTNSRKQEKLFSATSQLRHKYFNNKIFAYGFVYFSTYCRNNCRFCYYRYNNAKSPRYRKDLKEILQVCRALKNSGVHLLDLTMGEDPFYYQQQNLSNLLEMVSAVKEEINLPIMAFFGLWPEEMLKDLYQTGADWYACYQETHNRKLYRRLRINQNYYSRLSLKQKAQQTGFLIEDGILLGVGENLTDRARSILTMESLKVDQGRVMSFIPQEGTPLEKNKTPKRNEELLMIAALRLALKNVLIPASLDVDGIKGLKDRLQAGANVVTSIIPPTSGLKGVSNSRLDIEEGNRTIAGVKNVLESTDLELASVSDYVEWITARREMRNDSTRE